MRPEEDLRVDDGRAHCFHIIRRHDFCRLLEACD